tara:strand:+ start:1288 stop:1410 length:123 start_codon:yes stop_codon:yes gene_type:complete
MRILPLPLSIIRPTKMLKNADAKRDIEKAPEISDTDHSKD